METLAAIHTPLTSCRLCGSDFLERVLTLAPTPAGDRYVPKDKCPEKLPVFPLSLNQCKKCGHVQLEGILNPSYLYRDYIYTTNSSLGLAEHFEKYAAATIERLSLKKSSFVVEIGSNDGTMLQAFKNLGMKVLGIDPASEIAKKATQAGILTLPEFFSKNIVNHIVTEYGQADLIIANNVMANVADVRSIAESVKQLIAPDGVFVFETGYLKYLAEDYTFDNIYHEHIDYFSIRPLQQFFSSLGMQLFDVMETKSKGSSIRCFVGHSTKNRVVSSAVLELGDRELRLGYNTPLPYERLGRLLRKTKNELHSLLDEVLAKGEIIAGFGASVGVTTVLYEFDLGEHISFLLDDNPARDGLFSPGMAIPVLLAERELNKAKRLAVVILAWRYEEKILARHVGTNQQFVRFFPEVESLIQKMKK